MDDSELDDIGYIPNPMEIKVEYKDKVNEEQGPGEKELEEIKQSIIDEQKPSSYEEWNSILLQKRQNLEHIVKQNLPHLWLSIQLIVSIKCILNIANCTLPVLMILLGAASSNKTVPIEMIMEEPNTYYTDSFSAKAFVSHSTAVKKKDLKEIDMLPKIRFKLFLAPEMSPMFTKKDEDLIEIIGILTRIADEEVFKQIVAHMDIEVILAITCLPW